MALLRCPTCGAKVKTKDGNFTAACEYCGNEMTVFESTAEFESDSKGTLVQYNGKSGDIVIPDGIRRIGDSAFDNYKGVEKIHNQLVLPWHRQHKGNNCMIWKTSIHR